MTMQNIVPDPSRYPIPDVDVYLTGAEDSLPPANYFRLCIRCFSISALEERLARA